MNAHSYNITIRQIEVDGRELFEARVRELPDVVDFGDTWEEAYELAVDTIQTTAEIMAERGRRMPEPGAVEDDYSGRVTLRIPKSLHRRLAEQAEHESISLNQYLVSLLAFHAGTTFANRDSAKNIWRRAETGPKTTRRSSAPNLKVIDSDRNPTAPDWQRTG